MRLCSYLPKYSRSWLPPALRPKSRSGFAQSLTGLQTRAVRLSVDVSTLMNIGVGERAAILLAQEDADVLLLIDDAARRAEANRLKIANIGTLGVLREAALRELLDLRTAFNLLTRLSQLNTILGQN